jgi:hypothetical protein
VDDPSLLFPLERVEPDKQLLKVGGELTIVRPTNDTVIALGDAALEVLRYSDSIWSRSQVSQHNIMLVTD